MADSGGWCNLISYFLTLCERVTFWQQQAPTVGDLSVAIAQASTAILKNPPNNLLQFDMRMVHQVAAHLEDKSQEVRRAFSHVAYDVVNAHKTAMDYVKALPLPVSDFVHARATEISTQLDRVTQEVMGWGSRIATGIDVAARLPCHK